MNTFVAMTKRIQDVFWTDDYAESYSLKIAPLTMSWADKVGPRFWTKQI